MSDTATRKLVDYLTFYGLQNPTEVVRFLKDGADPTARDAHGKSVLMHAAESEMFEDILEMGLYTLYKTENNIKSSRIFFDDGEYGNVDVDGSHYDEDNDDFDDDDDDDYNDFEADSEIEKDIIDYDMFDYEVAREYGINNDFAQPNHNETVLKRITTPEYVSHLNEALHIAAKSNAIVQNNIELLLKRGADAHAKVNGILPTEAALESNFYEGRLEMLAKLECPFPSLTITGQPYLLKVRDITGVRAFDDRNEFLSLLMKMAPQSVDVAPLRFKKNIIGQDGQIDPQANRDDSDNDNESSVLLSLSPTEEKWDQLTKSLYIGHQKKHPDWSFDEFNTRLQSMLFAHACGIAEDLSHKDPAGWAKDYADLNTIRNRDGTVRGQRNSLTAAKHVQDFLDSLAKQTVMPALIKRHPDVLAAWGDRIIEETKVDLRHVIGQALCDVHHPTNTPAPGRIKIAKAAKRHLINNTHIRRESKDPTITTHGQWESITPPVQGPNGYWFITLPTSEAVGDEALDRQHCLDQNLHSFLFQGVHPLAVRRDPDVPEYTAAVQPNSKRDGYTVFSEPLGYQNETAQSAARADWEWYVNQLNDGVWGTPKEKIAYSENRIDLLKQDPTVNETVIRIGFDPMGEKGFEFAQKAWSVWGHYMGDLMRYRKMPFTDMLEQSGINEKLDAVAAKHMARARKYGLISDDTPPAAPAARPPAGPAP